MKKLDEIFREKPINLFEFYEETYHLHHTWTWQGGNKHVTPEKETPLKIACTDFIHTRDGRSGCLVIVSHPGDRKSFVLDDKTKDWAEAYDYFIEMAEKLYEMESNQTPLKVSSPNPTGATTNREARDMGNPALAD